jgi:hypothetical protein
VGLEMGRKVAAVIIQKVKNDGSEALKQQKEENKTNK